jgi:aminoglycoside 3'-phosphotransferase-2
VAFTAAHLDLLISTHPMRTSVLSSLPAEWRVHLAGRQIIPITTGMSGADVFRIVGRAEGDQYLKLGRKEAADLVRSEIERTEWLHRNEIPVATTVKRFDHGIAAGVIMTGLSGTPLDQVAREDWKPIVKSVALAFARLHSLRTAECPFDEGVRMRLSRARVEIERGGVDPNHFDSRNLALTPQQLYDGLRTAIPAREDLVVVHGDATLSNLILQNDGTIGFIDCGNAGRADRYVDLAILIPEIVERFGARSKEMFLNAYGLAQWDERKALFYSDLYELF